MAAVGLPGALVGTRVVEVGNFIAAPFCAAQLADLGADVVKIERPGTGDPIREAGPFVEGESSSFIRMNRNKRSLALDLHSTEGRAVLRRLLVDADVLVENLRPGAMRALGLGFEPLSEENPRLVYVSASGWGQDGPYAMRPGLDIVAQAMSGLMSITGEPGGAPVKVGVPVCDLVCGLYGALGALGALQARATTGRGQHVDVSLFESATSLAIWEAGTYFATGEVAEPHGSAHQAMAPYQAIRTKDGSIVVGAASPSTWEGFCRALHLEHLLDDPRYARSGDRFLNSEALIEVIEAETIEHDSAPLVELLLAAGVPAGPINRYDAVFNDPHLVAREFFVTAEHTRAGKVAHLASPIRLSQTPTRIERSAPLLGEHGIEVLLEAGYKREEIDVLIETSVVAVP